MTPRVVAAFPMPNGATRVVRDDGSMWDWWEGEQAWHLVAPPIPTATPERVEVADQPEPWKCRQCDNQPGGVWTNPPERDRCGRCGSAKP